MSRAEWICEVTAMFDAAIVRADMVDRELGTLTRIEVEPGGLVVRMECRGRQAVGIGVHTVSRTCGWYFLHNTDPSANGLLATLGDVATQMIEDREEYALKRERGELTGRA